ncbi:TIM44-like domain-containing protein [Piscinibacter sp. XHJ-5]|uniref:Tim44 domain-containing protein n=1 Tax=Piscinibacter sp. XHJ-5 TaxID=3037797 RepID=UPI00245338D5|nr:TIM44-like domain-containing protein [Piscinibacter sp. XHJ-5]
MKSILLSVFIGLLGLTFSATDVEAKRLGGGISQGMKRQAPPPRQTPDNTTTPQQAPTQQATAPTAGAATAAAATPKRSWLGPVAGLAAGLGIAALMSHLGFGEAFGNILTLLLVAIVAVWLVRFLLRRFAPGAQRSPRLQPAGAHAGGMETPVWRDSAVQRSDVAALPADRPLAAAGGASRVLPAHVDAGELERAAKMIFLRMQAANDAGDLADLRQFSTPEMFAAFRLDLQDRQGKPQRTDVVKLDAEAVDWAVEKGQQIVSVRFHGLIREEDEGVAAPFDEVWHLARPEDGSQPWAIAGIQQLAPL